MKTNRFNPNYAVPPGSTLLETIEALGMSQAQLAQRMGRPLKTINEIIKGKAAITAETALQLEQVLRVPASFWNNAERNYREALARRGQAKCLQEEVSWLHELPLRRLIAFQWIRSCNEPTDQLAEVLNFFGVASPAAWRAFWQTDLTPRLAVEFRKSPCFESNWVALAAWLRKGELEAQEIKTAEYDADTFKRALGKIRKLTAKPVSDFEKQIVELCANSGVALTFVPPLPKTHVSGATRWLSATKALIQLSLRGKSDDLLWFTFFHEAGHILLHGKRDVFIEDNVATNAKEEQANQFAADFLIPPTEWKRFVSRVSNPQRQDVRRFAADLGIAPGIVVGRLQHEQILPRSHLNDLKVRFEFVDPSE